MSKFVIAIALMFTASLSQAVCDIEDLPMRSPSPFAVKTSSQGNLALFSAPVRSLKDLKAHLLLQGNSSPLALLPEQKKQEFIDQLTFNENGLTGYRYSILEKELTPSQIYTILSLFGVQRHISVFRGAKISTKADAQLLRSGASTNVADECNPASPTPGAPGAPGAPGGSPGSGAPGSGGGGIDGGLPHGYDYKNYACKTKSTCSTDYGSICMSSC